MNKLTSRKFLSALALAAITVLSGLDVISLQDEALSQLLMVGLGWMGVEGAVDVVRALRNLGGGTTSN